MAIEVGKSVALADVELSEVYEQITERIEIEARRRNALPAYPASVIQGVVWLVVRDR